MSTGIKHDEGKPRMSLIPQKAVREVAKVMTFGAEKYGTHNYLLGMDHLRLIDAALRHINSHLTGETLDPESGVLHLAHAASSVLMTIELILNGAGEDNRFIGYGDNTTPWAGSISSTDEHGGN